MRKKILIYGMGLTGIELVRFCKKNKIPCVPFDDTKKLINKSEKVFGPKDNFKNLLKYCNEIVVSPGIGLRNKNIQLAIKSRKKIISEIEFASRYITKPIVAITGTNGKTTTTLLTSQLLKSGGYKVFLGGNIGRPLISSVALQNQYDLILVEVSSFQLQFIQSSFKPFVSAFLNISENHLDHHWDMDEYAKSKMNIFKNQDKNCFALCSRNVYRRIFNKNKASFLDPFGNSSLSVSRNKITINNKDDIHIDDTKLLGLHNLNNISFALSIFSIFKNISSDQLKVVENFSSPSHRLEIIKKYRERTIVNDSKSTSPQATEVALRSLKKNIVLIMGGKNKGLDYSLLKRQVDKKVIKLILFGENKFELAKFFNKSKKIIAVDLRDAVEEGLKKFYKGHTLLLSPGTSSFDQFDSYSDRGDKFKEYVKKLS